MTEDPSHPKSLWPSDISCPECRPHPWNIISSQRNMMQTIDGVLWNNEATSNYLMNLYANDKIVGNTKPDKIDINEPVVPTIAHNVILHLQSKFKLDYSKSNVLFV